MFVWQVHIRDIFLFQKQGDCAGAPHRGYNGVTHSTETAVTVWGSTPNKISMASHLNQRLEGIAMSDVKTDGVIDIPLEDMTDDLELEETNESPASDEKVDESSEADTEAKEETDEEPKGEETEDEEESKDETKVEETNPEEARKAAAREAYHQRQAARAKQEAQLAAAQAQELAEFAEAVNGDQEQIAFKQQQQAFYQTTISTNVDRLSAQVDQARTIPIFQDMTPARERAFNDAIDEFLIKNVTTDALGNPLQVKGNLYDFLQTKASLIEDLRRDGAKQEKSDTAKQRAAVTPRPGGSPKPPKVDQDLADFDAAWG